MDDGVSNIDVSRLLDEIPIVTTDIEEAALADLDKLSKEADEKLKKVFWNMHGKEQRTENGTESESGNKDKKHRSLIPAISAKEEVEDLTLKNCELQRKHQQLKDEKNKWINKMSEEFAAQKKCQLFLESGAIEEINHLKCQIHHLEEEMSNTERENSLLKKEVEDLTLRNCELLKKYQQLKDERIEWINEMSKEFVAQKKCQLFLESGTIEEIKRLNHQVQHLQAEKSRIERENFLLQESLFLSRPWAHSFLTWQFRGLCLINNMITFPLRLLSRIVYG